MIDTFINWVIPFILTTIFGYIAKELKENKKHDEAMRNSMVLLLRSQITGKCENYLKMGFLPDYARSCLEDLYKQYESLGGNHGVKKLVDQTFNLKPLKED